MSFVSDDTKEMAHADALENVPAADALEQLISGRFGPAAISIDSAEGGMTYGGHRDSPSVRRHVRAKRRAMLRSRLSEEAQSARNGSSATDSSDAGSADAER